MTESLHLLRPLWLLGIPLFWLLVWWHQRSRRSGGIWSQVIDSALQPYVLNIGNSGGRTLGGGVLASAGTIALVALAGPTWEREPVPVFRSESALVVALDLSASMNAEDVAPSRLELARFKVADLLALRKGGQSALTVFAAQSFVVTPLTDDVTTLLGQLRGLDTSIMPSQGSEPAAALAQARELLNQAGVVGGHVLLVTDGADEAALARAQAEMDRRNYTLSVLGVGTATGAPIPDTAGGFARRDNGEIIMSALDTKGLRDLAAAGNGLFLDLTADDSEILRLERFVQASLDDRAQKLDDLAAAQWRESGPWLLLLVLPFAALGFRRGALVGWLCAALLPALLQPLPVSANWFRTPDQAGAAAFEQGAYDNAAESFVQPEWRGAAQYRGGDYAGAVATFADRDDVRGHYNRGNALARLGRYEEAVAAYDSALEQQPRHADAAHNKALLEEILKQQSEQQPPQDGQQDKQEKGDQEQQSDQQQGEGEQGGEQSSEEADQEVSGGNSRGGSERDSEESNESGSKSGQQEAKQEGEEREPNNAQESTDLDADAERELERESQAERAQATEQWLRQIPDDPAGLLRRKFQYQYKQRYGNAPYKGDRW